MEQILDSIGGAGVVGGVVVLLVVLFQILAINSLIVIVPPNMAAVITGRKRRLPDGQVVGYRTVIGGSTLRIPIIEQVSTSLSRRSPMHGVERVLHRLHPDHRPSDREVKERSEPESDLTTQRAVRRKSE